MASFLTEAAATLEYSQAGQPGEFSLGEHAKTVDLIGEEFIKKGSESDTVTTTSSSTFVQSSEISSASLSHAPMMSGSLPPLTYTTTTTIPTIASQHAQGSEEAGVLYCNLDDLSRYIPDNFSFDQIIGGGAGDSIHSDTDNVSVQVLSLPSQAPKQTIQTLSFPNSYQRQTLGSAVQIQVKPPCSGVQTLSLAPGQVIDTTKLTGQLSVVQELPEVSKLVFQEVKQEQGHDDSIVNILENMKTEQETAQSISSAMPLDYTVSVSNTSPDTPLNLVNNMAKGVKRVTAPVQHIPHDAKRIKNVYVVQGQNGQQIIQEVPVSSFDNSYPLDQKMSPHSLTQDPLSGNILCLDPPSPNDDIKKEPKSKSNSPKINSNLNKSINSTMPSSKTCNWVFENGQVCGKTFSKSYNLVVHMRMHEDIRPFACTLCDQTFRQKAHLQRHETTHGIQNKNIYRQPAAAKKKKKKAAAGQTLSKGLQNRLAKINQNLNKANGDINEDSTGEEFMEDEEDEMYVPNGTKTAVVNNGKYSESEHSNGFENQLETGLNNNINKKVGDLNMNIISSGEVMDDDTSTVQDILHTVNSVPTLEQSLGCDSLLLRQMPGPRHILSQPSGLPHITKLVESTSISSLPSLSSELATTSSTTLPGSSYSMFNSVASPGSNSNILFTTLSAPSVTHGASSQHKQLSFIETSVPGTFGGPGCRQVVIDNIEEHSPEIQAEILNALLADQTGYVETGPGQDQVQELWEEEIYRLTTLPATWWVSRKRRSGTSLDEVSYYSPEGYCFKNRSEIQDFLQHNSLPKDLRTEELRSPPLPIDQIPVIEESYVHRGSVTNQPMDANSIAQALIANLKPEPLESLKESLSSSALLEPHQADKLRQDSLSLPSSPAPPMTLSPVS